MGTDRIDEDPIQMQPVLSMTPKDIRDELDAGHLARPVDGGTPDNTAPDPAP